MAKVHAPLFSMTASGKLKERLVFSQRASGQQARLQLAQKDTASLDRTYQRGLYTSAVAVWNAYSASQKAVYNSRAEHLHMTGYNLFMKETIAHAGYDTDSLAYFNALATAGVPLTFPEKVILNTLVLALKNANLWTKFYAIYPFMGITSTSQKFNLIDPRDLDVAYRLAFIGGWTHSVTGALPNSTNTYAKTFFNNLSHFSATNCHLSFYSRTAGAATGISADIGCGNTTLTQVTNLDVRRNTNSSFAVLGGSAGTVNYANTDGRGLYMASKNSSTLTKAFRNTSVRASGTDNTAMPNFELYISAFNQNNTAVFFSNKQCAFASIGTGFSDLEETAFYNIIQAFQTSLSRNV